jgi:hypothetical protein
MKKKLSLVFLFALGTFAIIIAIVKTILYLNQATLFVVIVWSSSETVVSFLVVNGPALRPLFFRGNSFDSTSNSDLPRLNGGAASHDAYELAPKGVVSKVTTGAAKSPGARQEVFSDRSVLRTVEVTMSEEHYKRQQSDDCSMHSQVWV